MEIGNIYINRYNKMLYRITGHFTEHGYDVYNFKFLDNGHWMKGLGRTAKEIEKDFVPVTELIEVLYG